MSPFLSALEFILNVGKSKELLQICLIDKGRGFNSPKSGVGNFYPIFLQFTPIIYAHMQCLHMIQTSLMVFAYMPVKNRPHACKTYIYMYYMTWIEKIHCLKEKGHEWGNFCLRNYEIFQYIEKTILFLVILNKVVLMNFS
jgi:hypothetical protein